MISVLLADDQSLVRAGFRMILTSEPDLEVVGEAGNGAEAAERAAELKPDVVLMDVRMPGVDGIESTRRITTVDEPPRVIVLTTFDRDEYVYEALRAGASAFLLKDAPEHQLLAAIRVAADGGSLFAPSVTRRLIERSPRQRVPPMRPGWTSSSPASSRYSASSRAGSQTPRSPITWSSANTRPRPTWPGSCSNSGCAIASRPSCSPMRQASCSPAPERARPGSIRQAPCGGVVRPQPLRGCRCPLPRRQT
jgi:DNA-binding NarL/FixJ family response regulator